MLLPCTNNGFCFYSKKKSVSLPQPRTRPFHSWALATCPASSPTTVHCTLILRLRGPKHTRGLCSCCSLCLQSLSSRWPPPSPSSHLPSFQSTLTWHQPTGYSPIREHANVLSVLLLSCTFLQTFLTPSHYIHLIFCRLFCVSSTSKQCPMINKCLLNKWTKQYTF